MSTLMKASGQWASRPAHERFNSIEDLHENISVINNMMKEIRNVPYASLRAEAAGNEVLLVGKNNKTRMTHWAFGQLAQRVGAPAGYLRDLPPTLAAQNLNHGLAKKQNDGEQEANLYVQRDGDDMLLRGFTTDKYTRIYNTHITSRLVRLKHDSKLWREAPAAFDGSRGQYGNHENIFSFFVDNERRIFERNQDGGLSRGFFVWNSEVGAKSFGVCTFMYQYVCGNHIVWGAENVRELRIRHVGDADDRVFAQLEGQLIKYATSSAKNDEARIEKATKLLLGKNKDEVLDGTFKLAIPGVTRRVLDQAYDTAVKYNPRYGDPRSAWAMASGMTQVSRDLPYADDRDVVDRAAGKLLDRVLN